MNSSITSHSTDSLERKKSLSSRVWMEYKCSGEDIELPVKKPGLSYQRSSTYAVLLGKWPTFRDVSYKMLIIITFFIRLLLKLNVTQSIVFESTM